MMNAKMDQLIDENVELRKNMPLNNKMGNDAFRQRMGAMFAQAMRECVDARDKLMNECMERRSVRFLSNRYPPLRFLKPCDFILYGLDKHKLRKEKVTEPAMVAKDEMIERIEDRNERHIVINEESMVRLVNPQWMRCVDYNQDEDDIDLFLKEEEDS